MENANNNKCPICDGAIQPQTDFCPGCGTSLVEAKKSKKSKGSSNYYIFFTAVAVVVIAAYFMFSSSPKKVQEGFTHPEVSGMNEAPIDLQQLMAQLPDDYNSLVEKGNAYMDKRIYPMAIECYNRAVTIDASDPNVLTDLGTCYFSAGDNNKAIEIFKNVIEQYPEHKIVYLNMGIVYFSSEKPDSAKAYWNKLIERFPEDPIADTVKKYMEQFGQ